MSRPRLTTAFAVAAATLLATVLGLRVISSFTEARVKAVRQPIVASERLAVQLPETPLRAALIPPYAVVWRIRHAGPATGRFTLSINGQPVCDRPGENGRSTRFDCASPVANPAVATIDGPGSFAVEYLELATHHGGITAPHRALVAPEGTPFRGPPLLLAICAGVLLAAVIGAAPAVRRAPWRHLYRAASAFVMVMALLVLLSPVVSPYLILITPAGWLLWVAVILAPALSSSIAWLSRRAGFATACLLALGATAVTLIVIGAASEHHAGNYSGFLRIERHRAERHPVIGSRPDMLASLRLEEQGGYDGQFMFFMAFDPLLRHAAMTEGNGAIDTPPYRYGRIGFVWLIKAVSLDQWQRYASSMIWMTGAALVMCALLIALLARQIGASPWWGLSALAMPGLWRSLHLGLPEPIAGALVLTALMLFLRERRVAAALTFAAALLVRETTAIPLLVTMVVVWRTAGWRPALRYLAIAAAPFLLWRVYIAWRLFDTWGAEAIFLNPATHGLPLAGIISVYNTLSAGAYWPNAPEVARGAMWLPPLLVSATVLSLLLVWRRRTIVTVSAAMYALAAVSLNSQQVWSHVANVERTTYELFLLLGVGLAMESRHARWPTVAGVVFWSACAIYVLFGTYDAEFTRRTLFGWR